MIPTSPPMRDHEVWHTAVWLEGCAAYRAESYPMAVRWDNDKEGFVEVMINEAVPGPVILGRETLRQRLDLTVTASEGVAPDLAFNAASTLADTLSFATSRRVEMAFSPLTTAPPGVNKGDYRTILNFTPIVPSDEPLDLSVVYIKEMGRELGDLTSERSGRIVRSLRWLRRCYTTPDPVLAFSALAFALEALVALLPTPPSEKKGKKKSPKPGTSEKLKHFAVVHAHASESAWQFVGGLRHALFHGGIHEDLEGEDRLLQAIPLLRRVVVIALKHVLSIPAATLSAEPPNLLSTGTPRIVVNGVLRAGETEP